MPSNPYPEPEFLNILKLQLKRWLQEKSTFSNGILKQPDYSLTAVSHCGQETYSLATGLNARGGHAQLFFESAIAIPQLEGSTSAIAIPQLLKKCSSAIATPQFCNRNFFRSPQLQVRNLRTLLPQFSAYIWPWSSLKLEIFLPPGFFCYERILKGQQHKIFGLCFFRVNPNEPESYSKRGSNSVSNRNNANQVMNPELMGSTLE